MRILLLTSIGKHSPEHASVAKLPVILEV